LLGACSSVNSASDPLPTPPPAVRITDSTTVWGKRPSYDPKGQYFIQVAAPNLHMWVRLLTHNVAATLDLLVNRDGTVQDAAVVESSGDPKTDVAVMAMYRHARYSLPLGPDAPAPYVVRQRFVSKGDANAGTAFFDENPDRYHANTVFNDHPTGAPLPTPTSRP
jgi:TonB family protein